MARERDAELLDYFVDRKVWLLAPDEQPVVLEPYELPRPPGRE